MTIPTRRTAAADGDAYAQALDEDERRRRRAVEVRRLYAAGAQYDEQNAETLYEYRRDLGVFTDVPLPEHERLHAYSSHVAEITSFLAGELAAGFVLAAEDETVQSVLDEAFDTSDRLNPDAIDDVVEEALLVGDVVAEVGWDDVLDEPTIKLYDSEDVEVDFAADGTIAEVCVTTRQWVDSGDGPVQRDVARVYLLAENPAGVEECQQLVYYDDDEDPSTSTWVGVPVIPFVVLRARRGPVGTWRGKALVTDRILRHVDRYDSVEQTGWLIARYNSHGSLAVVGDAALLQFVRQERMARDVPDVLTFPGGTSVQGITLPTDATMLDHQRQEVESQLYRSFGIVNLDVTTVQSLGQTSGYALEILNRKTEATFRRIRSALIGDLTDLCDLILDVVAYRADVAYVDVDGEPVPSWETVDPEVVFPNRTVEIRLGSAFVVDDVLHRMDFQAGLISRREALRKKGYDDEAVEQVVAEVEFEQPQLPELTGLGGIGSGSTIARQPAGTI